MGYLFGGWGLQSQGGCVHLSVGKEKEMRNVLIVSALDRIAPRIRIEKETLEKEGYGVTVLRHRRALWGWRIFAESPVYYFRIIKGTISGKVDAVELTHLAQLLVSPILKLLGKVVIYDAYDRYSVDISERYFPPRLKKAARNLVEFFENLFVKCFVDAMFTVSTRNEYLYKRYRRYCSKVEVLYNVPPLRLMFNGDVSSKFAEESLKIVYAGGFHAEKGLSVLKAFALELIKMKVPYELHLVGSFRSGEKRIAFGEDLKSSGLSERVFLDGYMDYPDLVRFLQKCHVGLSLYSKVRRFEVVGVGASRKNFTYMASGIVVITSNIGQLGKPIRDEGCGYVVDDPEAVGEIASILVNLHQNRAFACSVALKGIEAVRRRYNWETEGIKFISVYKDLWSSRQGRTKVFARKGERRR